MPFKNDAVKNAVLREQAKADASRMGVPMEVIAKAQRREQEEELANDPIAQLGGRKAAQPAAAVVVGPRTATESARLPPHTEHIDEGEEAAEESDDDDEQDEEKHRTCTVM